MRRGGLDVYQRWQNVREKPSATRIKPHVAAYLDALIAVPKFRSPINGAGKQVGRVNRDGRQIAGENEGTLRRKEKHSFNTRAPPRRALSHSPSIGKFRASLALERLL